MAKRDLVEVPIGIEKQSSDLKNVGIKLRTSLKLINAKTMGELQKRFQKERRIVQRNGQTMSEQREL